MRIKLRRLNTLFNHNKILLKKMLFFFERVEAVFPSPHQFIVNKAVGVGGEWMVGNFVLEERDAL